MIIIIISRVSVGCITVSELNIEINHCFAVAWCEYHLTLSAAGHIITERIISKRGYRFGSRYEIKSCLPAYIIGMSSIPGIASVTCCWILPYRIIHYHLLVFSIGKRILAYHCLASFYAYTIIRYKVSKLITLYGNGFTHHNIQVISG